MIGVFLSVNGVFLLSTCGVVRCGLVYNLINNCLTTQYIHIHTPLDMIKDDLLYYYRAGSWSRGDISCTETTTKGWASDTG